jgi:Gas vesicle synthesis protein GvpL/GvpF
MTVLLYAIAEGEPGTIDGTGLDGRDLRGVGDGGLVAVVSDHQPRAATPTAALWEYEETVESLMDRLTVLPVRFGSVLADDAAARAELRARRAWLRQALRRVRGAVELGVRASRPDGQAPPARAAHLGDGTAYMLARLREHRRAQAVADRLASLRALARASTQRVLPDSVVPVRGAYLVECDRVGEFAAAVRCLDRELPEVALVCTGPWPPYSFAREGEE